MESTTNHHPGRSAERPTYMTTLSSVLEQLRIKKLDNEWKWTAEGFTLGKGKNYQPEDLTIIKVYRFEGESDPADSSILYIIEAKDQSVGYSLDMYGLYSNHDGEQGYDSFIRQIKVDQRDEQIIFSD
ncbi:hypothetical protein [Arundinibacter roseus]|uniref:Phosphoribosylpyrophosphate synthetase n=1 Tax=Arundinibacter roseus TaxID=2070510 RepID=A0A4R4KN53_9BACT|nr:hypothetical protein [Arundinibacter roseus]TDB68149.1 hypothetical protein EZE20_04290 [Arundinibacter roseus]